MGYVKLISNGDSQVMRRLATLLAALSLMALAGTALAGGGGVPPFPRLPGAWSHAEINVTIKRTQHTLILDRGRTDRHSVAVRSGFSFLLFRVVRVFCISTCLTKE